MIIFLLACIISFIPYIALFLWLRNTRKGDEVYRKICNKTLLRGILCIFPILLLSGICYVALRLTRLHETIPLLYEALYTFIVLALAEEIVKYLAFRSVLKKSEYEYSWLDVTILMAIIGIGFGLIESVVYTIGASVPVVLIRGICMPHAGYGFILGYFYGKGAVTGDKKNKWIGFLISWLMHGLYDFSLSEELIAVSEGFMAISLVLAIMDIVLVILLIRYVKKTKKQGQQPISLPLPY